MNASLHPGAVQRLSLRRTSPSINTENATQAGLISGTQVRELVLSSRNYEQLVGLQPGVAYSGADQICIGNSNPGGAASVVNFSVGVREPAETPGPSMEPTTSIAAFNSALLTYPSVDAIAEFNILRGSYEEAEFGRSASGQINVITKSGTNNFHGGAYELFATTSSMPTTY